MTLSPPPQPHNIEAEQALLGALLLNNDVADRLTGLDQFPDLLAELETPARSRFERVGDARPQAEPLLPRQEALL